MNFKCWSMFIFLLWSFDGCTAMIGMGDCPSTPIISSFNAKDYVGKWYEIERFTNWFQLGLECVSAEYGFINETAVTVLNQGINM